MPARVLVLGLDAAETTLLNRWAAEGHLPTIARLLRVGRAYSLGNSLETLPGAIWPEITTGIACGKKPLYYHPRQLHTGEARVRPIRPDEIDPHDFFWSAASAAGHRVAVVDPVQAVPVPNFNGIQLFEWGLHDRTFEIASEPPELLPDVRERHGDHPIDSCDRHRCTESGYERLLDGLLAGAERKTKLLLDLLARENWDLFVGTYSESHCVGHQFWHFLDPQHPWHDPAAPARLRNAIRSVYQAIDSGLAEVIEAAGRNALILIIASHGMGPNTGGPQLLPEVLVRLGFGSSPGTGTSWVRRLKRTLSYAPRPLQPVLKEVADIKLLKRVQARSGALIDPLESPETRAVALRNNRCGAIRLNLKGREPFGRVTIGDEQQSLVGELREELLALKDPTSGQPIVTAVKTAVEAFGPEHHQDVPDLMVLFRGDLGLLESCTSSRAGLVQVPVFHPDMPRSGEHTPNSCLWLLGRGIQPGQPTQKAHVLDIAPTVLHAMNVPMPEGLAGRTLFNERQASETRSPQGESPNEWSAR